VRTELPALPPVSNTPAPVSPLPQPGGLPLPKDTAPTTPVGLPPGGTTPGGGLPALPAVELTPGGSGGNQDMKGVPLPGVAPFGETGRTAESPKLPATTTAPAALTSSNTGSAPAPAPIGLPAVKESPFKEERPGVPLPSAPSPSTTAPSAAPTTVPVNTLTPAGGSVPAPATSPVESTPKTDFDVDLVRVRSGDTYASISEVFYGSKQYAAALRTFNRGADLGQLREVQVPPMHIIRKQVSTRDGGAADDGRGLPTGNSRLTDDGRGLPSGNIRGPVLDAPVQSDSPESIDWNSPGKRRSSGR